MTDTVPEWGLSEVLKRTVDKYNRVLWGDFEIAMNNDQLFNANEILKFYCFDVTYMKRKDNFTIFKMESENTGDIDLYLLLYCNPTMNIGYITRSF